MDPFFAPITLLSLLLVASLVVHLIVWRRVDSLRQESARMAKVRHELSDALAVANAAKEEQAGRIAWLSGRLDAEAKQPDWERFERSLEDQLARLAERVNQLPTLEEVARIQGVADLLAERAEGQRDSDVVQVTQRR